MDALFLKVLDVFTPVLLCVAIGFTWARLKMPFDTKAMTPLLINIGGPCLIISKLSNTPVPSGELLKFMLAALVSYSMLALIVFVLLKILGLPWRTFIGPLVLGNHGNLGVPLCLLAFGERGLALGLAYMAVSSVIMFTAGISFYSGVWSLKNMLKMPPVWAVGVAIALALSGLSLPKPVHTTLDLLGSFVIPLMLLSLGVGLSRLTVRSLSRSFSVSLLRVVPAPLVGVFVAWIFGFSGDAFGVLVLQSFMPIAVFNYLFAEEYERDPDDVASLIVVSTGVSLVFIPAALAVLL